MQGRQGKSGDSSDKPSTDKHVASLNGTNKLGKYNANAPHPRRPAGRSQPSQPPSTPRLARPSQPARTPDEVKPKRKSRGRLYLILGGFFVVFLACLLSFVAVNFFLRGVSTASGPSVTAVDFLSALNDQNYAQAYRDLGVAIRVDHSQDEFTKQAQDDDRCYGLVKSYEEVNDSAVVQGNSQSYTYSIKRDKLAQPYQLRLTLQQEKDGSWKIMSYGEGLGPGQNTPCVK